MFCREVFLRLQSLPNPGAHKGEEEAVDDEDRPVATTRRQRDEHTRNKRNEKGNLQEKLSPHLLFFTYKFS